MGVATSRRSNLVSRFYSSCIPPHDFIVGGGFFTVFSAFPLSAAWQAFGRKNGVPDLETMRERIGKYRKSPLGPREDPTIGCIILTEPFFFAETNWIPVPADWKPNIVQGKGYHLSEPIGRRLWDEVALRRIWGNRLLKEVPTEPEVEFALGLTRRRLGQGGFRLGVTEAYERRCAITGERTLPVLDAAHIRPVTKSGTHAISNGLLLRSDVHTLFDDGYVTVTRAGEFRVSRKLAEDWSNGRVYYALDGQQVRLPARPEYRPDPELLEWHSQEIFLG